MSLHASIRRHHIKANPVVHSKEASQIEEYAQHSNITALLFITQAPHFIRLTKAVEMGNE
jgi:hypothetical protein